MRIIYSPGKSSRTRHRACDSSRRENLTPYGLGPTPREAGDNVTYWTYNSDCRPGDLGNDWIVGGTGKDHAFGGWADDLINMDDDQTTAGGLNDRPDTATSYEDVAYGGAGRDVLIGNTGGDRLIDGWASSTPTSCRSRPSATAPLVGARRPGS